MTHPDYWIDMAARIVGLLILLYRLDAERQARKRSRLELPEAGHKPNRIRPMKMERSPK